MSMDWEIDLDFEGVNARVDAAIPIAAGKAMEHVRGVAVPLTPLREGQLVGSAGVTVIGHEGHLTFAGPYARYQHYGLDFHHTHGQALFLEQPMLTEAPKVFDIIADVIGDAL
jgi:hypothetical protein